MTTTIPIGSYVSFSLRGKSGVFMIVEMPKEHLEQFPSADNPNDKYGFQYIAENEIPDNAKIIKCKWNGDNLVECNP